MKQKTKNKKIDKKKLANKVFEDGIKKSIELIIVGAIIGFSLNNTAIVLMGVLAGSLYLKNNKINSFGVR